MNYTDSTLWQKSVLAAHLTRQHCKRLPRSERYILADQMARAAVSVMSNVAEGWSRETVRDKARFLAIAQGSLCELMSQMVLARMDGLLTDAEVKETLELWDEVGRMLSSIRKKYRDKIAKDQGRPTLQ